MRNIENEINNYASIRELIRQTQFERSEIISQEYNKNKSAFPATRMYPHGIPIPEVLAALKLNKEQIDKYDTLGKKIKKFNEDLALIRFILRNKRNSLKTKLDGIIITFPKRETDDPYSKRINDLQDDIKKIELWAHENNEKLPQPINKELPTPIDRKRTYRPTTLIRWGKWKKEFDEMISSKIPYEKKFVRIAVNHNVSPRTVQKVIENNTYMEAVEKYHKENGLW